MLRKTGVQLELLMDIDLCLLTERSIRGGIVQSNIRYMKANNKYLENEQDFNPDEPESYILYLDACNLYGYSLSLPLPTGNFSLVEQPDKVDWSNLPADSPHGFILECDVEVPDNVHEKPNDLPPLAENLIPPGGTYKKLLTTLQNKVQYVGHYTLFQQAERLGLKVTKVRRAIKFSQSPFMKKYIDFNSELRSKAKDEFSQSFFKLMNNAVFGKSLENVRNRVDVRIVTDSNEFLKLSRKPRYAGHSIIKEGDNDGIVLVHLHRTSVKLDKPIYLGAVTLDTSKVHMYNFFYNVLHPYFKKHQSFLSLGYLDTDGIVLSIETKRDINDCLKDLSDHLDLSNYPDGHPLKDNRNKQVAGKFKNETKERALYEHISLRPKLYAQRFSSLAGEDEKSKNQVIKKAKGVKKSFIKQKLTFEHYKKALFDQKEYTADFNLIRCRKFELTSVRVVKKALSCNDNKRFILQDNIHTLAWGHKQIKEIQDGQ